MYYPYRKIVGLLGFICFAISIVLTCQYLVTSKIGYAICDVAAIGLSIYLLGPFFRNQVVEVVDQSIVIHSFGKKNTLTADNLYEICHSKSGATSYRFSKGENYYQITPNVYTHSESMLKEFHRIFIATDKRKRKKS